MKKRLPVLELSSLQSSIHFIRGQRVMLDSDLAKLYGVQLKRMNQQVKRNADRFPLDFMFQLTPQELSSLRSQFVTFKADRGEHRKYLPYAFTEHGAIMLASVLNSPTAVEASILVVRAFVQLRELLLTHKELSAKLAQLEGKVAGHDDDIRAIITAIRQLMTPPITATKKIGFKRE
jgi:hypothetical protein